MFYLIEPPPDFAKGWLADPKVKGDPTLKVLLRPGCPGAREGQLQPTGVQRRLQTSLAPHILGGWLASWESQLIISLYVSLCILYIHIQYIYIICMHVYIYIHTCIYIWMYVTAYIYICMCECTCCMYMYNIYIYIDTDIVYIYIYKCNCVYIVSKERM